MCFYQVFPKTGFMTAMHLGGRTSVTAHEITAIAIVIDMVPGIVSIAGYRKVRRVVLDVIENLEPLM